MKSNQQNSLISDVIKCEERARRRMRIKYEETPSFYDVKVINDIIFNEESHFVATFKENLIFEEVNEFLKRYYNTKDIKFKITKILQFYEKYSKIYPNYTILSESKYIYKNIKRKQKMIDNMQNHSEDRDIELSSDFSYVSNIFDTDALHSINNVTHSVCQNSLNKDDDEMLLEILEYKNDESVTGLTGILNKITKAEKDKELNQKEFIGVNKKNIKDANILSPTMKSKVYDLKSKLKEVGGFKDQTKIQPKHRLLIGESLLAKFEKMLLTTNAGRCNGIKTERIVCSSGNKRMNGHTTTNSLNKGQATSGSNNSKSKNNIVNAYHNSSTRLCQRKQINQANNNISNLTSTHISSILKSKMISPRNSNHRLSPYTQNTSLERKSTSIPKNSSILSNVNIINHIQPGSTQINIYNGNDLLKSLKINGKTSNHSSSSKSKRNHKCLKKFQPKFELNIKKILHKNIGEPESTTVRKAKINFIDQVNVNSLNERKNHHKINSIAVSKFNTTDCKSISRIANNSQNKTHIRQDIENKVREVKSSSINNSKTINSSISKNHGNNMKKLKFKSVYETNKLLKSNISSSLSSNIDKYQIKKFYFK